MTIWGKVLATQIARANLPSHKEFPETIKRLATQ